MPKELNLRKIFLQSTSSLSLSARLGSSVAVVLQLECACAATLSSCMIAIYCPVMSIVRLILHKSQYELRECLILGTVIQAA
jgi:hypothetical protein